MGGFESFYRYVHPVKVISLEEPATKSFLEANIKY